MIVGQVPLEGHQGVVVFGDKKKRRKYNGLFCLRVLFTKEK